MGLSVGFLRCRTDHNTSQKFHLFSVGSFFGVYDVSSTFSPSSFYVAYGNNTTNKKRIVKIIESLCRNIYLPTYCTYVRSVYLLIYGTVRMYDELLYQNLDLLNYTSSVL